MYLQAETYELYQMLDVLVVCSVQLFFMYIFPKSKHWRGIFLFICDGFDSERFSEPAIVDIGTVIVLCTWMS